MIRRAPLTALLTLSIFSVAASVVACTPPPDRDDDRTQNDDDAAPLVAVRGQVSNALSVEPVDANGEQLRAYLIWLGQSELDIDVQGALAQDNSFQLNVVEEPATGVFNPEYPDLAFAMIYVMSENTADAVRRMNAGEEATVASGTVYGIAQHFVVFSATEEAAAAILPGVGAGFTLLGPDAEVVACQEEAYVAVDACIVEQSRCEPLLEGDEPNQEAYDACIVDLPTCDSEFAAVEACGPAMVEMPFDTLIDVALQRVE